VPRSRRLLGSGVAVAVLNVKVDWPVWVSDADQVASVHALRAEPLSVIMA